MVRGGRSCAVEGPPGTWDRDPPTAAREWGDNRETNVVNRWGFSYQVPNLGVLGIGDGTSGA